MTRPVPAPVPGGELLHHLLERTARSYPDAPAVSDATTEVSYRWLDRASRRLAGWLADRGVRRGDRVVLVAPPDVSVPALLYGCSRAGAAFVVTDARVPAPVLGHLLDDAAPALLVADDPNARQLATARGGAAVTLAQARAAAESPAVDPPARVPAGGDQLTVDPACFIYTSGSTGRPKAVVSTHAQVTFAVTAIQSQLGYRPDDVVYCPLPLSFDYGLYQLFLATLAGARVHLGSAAGAGAGLLANLHRTGATVLPAVPALAATLARMLSRPGARPPRLRLLTNTGAAMPDHLPKQLRAQISGLRIQLMYGLTECKRATIMPVDGDLDRPHSCGRALPGTEVFAVGGDGRRLPPGQVGEVVVRGPHVMAGYWHRPALTEARFPHREGLFPQLHTGDFGWLDEDGYLYFAGRRDDLYKERGFRVSTTEVEAAAHRVPGVQAAAAVPPAGSRDGATLFAVTTLAPAEVLARLRDQLEEFKVPRSCQVVAELPLTAHGKVDRVALARMVGHEPPEGSRA